MMSVLAGLAFWGSTSPAAAWCTARPSALNLLCMLIGVSALVLWRSPAAARSAGTLVVGAGYALARIPVPVAVAQAWPLRWFVLALLPVQAWLSGWVTAIVVVGTMVLAVLGSGPGHPDDHDHGPARLDRPAAGSGPAGRGPVAVAHLDPACHPVPAALLEESRQASTGPGCDLGLARPGHAGGGGVDRAMPTAWRGHRWPVAWTTIHPTARPPAGRLLPPPRGATQGQVPVLGGGPGQQLPGSPVQDDPVLPDAIQDVQFPGPESPCYQLGVLRKPGEAVLANMRAQVGGGGFVDLQVPGRAGLSHQHHAVVLGSRSCST
jgi:hypothetical protein